VSAVVVTGAAGFVGQRVVGRLAATPGGREPLVKQIVAVDVVPMAGDDSAESRVLDLARDPVERLVALMEGAGSLIHLAWSHSDLGLGSPVVPSAAVPRAPRVAPANLVALRRVLDAAARTGIQRVVHVSSATVYGAWADNPVPLPEDAALRPNPGFNFAVEKAEAERIIAEWSDEHPDVLVTILRPTVTVGSSGPPLYQALAGTRSPQPDDGSRPRQFLDVDDLASAVVFSWEHGLHGVFNVSPDGWITHEEARALAGGVARVTLPGRLARAVAAIGWKVLRTGTPKEALPYSRHPWVVANDRLRGAGWVPERTNEEALVASDDRSHWSDLPPSRRQEVALLAAGLSLAAMAAGATALGARLVSRTRRRTRGQR